MSLPFWQRVLRVKGWECLFHRKLGLFLSVYVDDFKMAGKKEKFAPMWATLRKKIDLEPPVPMDGNVYLGCIQQSFTPNP